MKITIEEGYKTTPVLVFYYGKEDQFKFRVTPRKAQLLLKYTKLVEQYWLASRDPVAIKKMEAELSGKVMEIDKGKGAEEIEVDLIDDALVIKEVALKPAAPAPVAKPEVKEPKIIVDDTGVTFE